MAENSGNLTAQAFSGLAKLAALSWVFLFLPAGTLDFWQAWIFWLVFSGCALLITLYFLKRDPNLIASRLRAGPSAEKEQSQKLIQTFAAALFVLVMVVPGLDRRFGWSHMPAWLSLAGNLAVALSFLIDFLVFRENSFTSAIIEVHAGQRVISTGPYRIVRHPLYAAAVLMFLAMPLALASWWAFLCIPALVAVIVWRLLEEEEFLARNLPGYDASRRRTRYRLIPMVW